MHRVRDVVRRAALLGNSFGELDLDQVLKDVREALARRDTPAAETILARAESELELIEAKVSPVTQSSQTWLRRKIATARQRLSQAIRKHPFATDLVALGIIALLWAAILVGIQLLSYGSFRLLNDIAAFNQVLYTTSHSQSLLFYSKDLPGGNNGQFFSVHFAPFLFVLVPFYYLFPGIPTLLVIKQVALGLGALPAYALGRAKLGSRAWGWLIAGVYLVTPLITGLDWANFDMESFMPVALLSTFYFFEVGRLRWFIVSLVVSLSLIESVAPLLALFAVVVLVGTVVPLSQRDLPRNRAVRKFASAALVASVVSLGLSYLFLTVVFRSPGGGSLGSGFSESFSILGASSIPDIPLRVLFHPGNAIAAVVFDGNAKLLYVLLLFGCLAFMPLFGELKYLFPALGWICGIAILANGSVYYAFSDHTLAYPAPFLIAGAVSGVRRAQSLGSRATKRLGLVTLTRSRWKSRWNSYAIGSILVAGLVVTVAVSSPWNTSPLGVPSGYPSGFEVPSIQDNDLTRVLTYLPSSASVLTTSVIFGAVSARKAAYLEPGSGVAFLLNWTNYDATAGGALAFHRVTQWYLNMSQYVVLDFQLDQASALAVLYFGNNLTGYGVVAADQGAILYERGWTSAPELWSPETTTLAARQSSSNASVYTTKAYHGLPVGAFTATFWWTENTTASGGSVKVAVKEVPVAVDPEVKYQTSAAAKYAVVLNLTGGPASTNRSSVPATGFVVLQLGFPLSVSFTITESQSIAPALLGVVITPTMP